jgi:predicted metalloendopeptidase
MRTVIFAALAMLSAQAIGDTQHAPAAADASQAKRPELGAWGVDLANMDKSVKPGDDFYRYVNGKWLAEDHIPADRSSWGTFAELRELSENRVKEILASLAGTSGAADPQAQKVRDLYASFVDEDAIAQHGYAPAKADLDRFAHIDNYEAVAAALADPRLTLASPFNMYINADDKNPDRYAVNLTQGGLGLPDRDYYLRDDESFPEIRKQYVAAIGKMLTLAGIADSEQKAQSILDLEHALAEVEWPVEQQRDAEKTYNPVTRDELVQLAPQFPWKQFMDSAQLGSQTHFIAKEKDAFPKLAQVFRSTPIDTWRAYLQFHYLQAFAPFLPKEMDDANFAFYGTVLSNQPAQLPRETRGVQFVGGAMGEAVGKIYVERYFPAESKAQMESLVANLRAAFADRVKSLEWMSDDTRQAALKKLDQFTVKIAYPDKWRDYSTLVVDAHDPLGNAQRAAAFEWHRQAVRLGGPVDRQEWGMTPQTINAYYNPTFNEIVFPAAILQPPFFDPNADPAVNYGGIGAVIGHEIGHGFDDQGSKYDGRGVLQSWWTEEDRSRFEERTNKLVQEYNAFEPLPSLHVKGELTLGENIGDLGGIQMAYAAYRRSLGGKEAPVIDGFTGDQRFFLGFGQIWRSQIRDGALRSLVLSNPHSPPQYRVNGVVPNVDAWYKAFGIPQDAKMALAQDRRVKIW